MRIRTKTRSEKAARTRKRNANPLLAAKRVAERPQPAKPDWETLRPEIHAKTEGDCYLCGLRMTPETMTTDHTNVEPMGCQKNNATENLMPCCQWCNSRKGSRRLTGDSCECGQQFLVKGLPCLRCERNENSGVRTERTGRFTI